MTTLQFITLTILYLVVTVCFAYYFNYQGDQYRRKHPYCKDYSALDDPEGLICFAFLWPCFLLMLPADILSYIIKKLK